MIIGRRFGSRRESSFNVDALYTAQGRKKEWEMLRHIMRDAEAYIELWISCQPEMKILAMNFIASDH